MNFFQCAYLMGKAAAESQFTPVAPPKPEATTGPEPHILPAAPATTMPNAAALKPLKAPTMKLSKFNFGLTPEVQRPDDIQTDNGTTHLRRDDTRSFGNAFTNFDTTAAGSTNPDVLDSGLEGPPHPWGV